MQPRPTPTFRTPSYGVRPPIMRIMDVKAWLVERKALLSNVADHLVGLNQVSAHSCQT